jgi:ubiquitin-protein ligase
MSAFAERIRQDLKKLDGLSNQTSGKVKVQKTYGNPPNKLDIVLAYRTAPSREYPRSVQNKTHLQIELLRRYPIEEPKATIKTPIFHPNVYRSGLICLGTKWLPTHGLDLLVKRIISIVIFDPTLLNSKSPANRDALYWYQKIIRDYPNLFPTDKLELINLDQFKRREIIFRDFGSNTQNRNTISWKNTQTEVEKVIVICPNCGVKNRVIKGQTGNLTCGRCKNVFLVKT